MITTRYCHKNQYAYVEQRDISERIIRGTLYQSLLQIGLE